MDSAIKLCNFGSNFRFETEAVFADSDFIENGFSEYLVTGLHIREINIGEHIGDKRQKSVSHRMPEIEHPVRAPPKNLDP